jgi:FMN reductase
VSMNIVTVVGNPRPESRTHGLARTLAQAMAGFVETAHVVEVDLAALGGRVLDATDPTVADAVETVTDADVLIVASPTYKGTYSGLTKVFLDRIATGALSGTRAVPILLGGAPNHQLAVDVHFTPLLLELGAAIPVRGLFVLESELADFPAEADGWVKAHAEALGLT